MKRNLQLLILISLLISLGACRAAPQDDDPGEDTIEPSDGISFGDTVEDNGGGGAEDTFENPRWVQPGGTAKITFFVDDRKDDRENQTFQDGDMKWTGSFSWSAEDNTIAPATSWLPSDGPYPLLYDDGPVNQGGHEMAGAEAGDHIFSTEVYFKAEEEETFQYGVLNEMDFWMWEGPNGEFTIPAGSTKTVHAQGLELAEFGAIDIKITVDTTNLHPDFAYIQDWPGISVYLKGNMNMWTPVPILDNGPDGGKGDDVAGDGLYTYVQSLNLGKHTGLLAQGQHAQFTPMFSSEEEDWVQAAEYKILLEGKQKGAKNGIHAFTRCGDGDWTPAEVFWETDSWGTTENTTVEAACEFVPECEVDDDCGEGEICQDDACVPDVQISEPTISLVNPATGPLEGGTLVTITGAEFQDGATVKFGGVAATALDVKDAGELTCATPAYGTTGKVDVTFTNPDGGTTTFPNAFTYIDLAEAPVIEFVDPAAGTMEGGTMVSILGQHFMPGPTVYFGTTLAAAVQFVDSTQVNATTPVHGVGPVDVRLINTDTQEDTLVNGYVFELDGIDWATLDQPTTAVGWAGQPMAEPLFAEVFEPGITDSPGEGAGLDAEFGYGPTGTDPSVDAWTWSQAEYHWDSLNNNVYTSGDVTIDAAGTYGFTFRFAKDPGNWLYADTDGSQNGFDPAMVGTLEITELGDDPVILTVTPGFGPLAGGTEVQIAVINMFGAGDLAINDVLIGGVSVGGTVVDDAYIETIVPAGVVGPVDVSILYSGPDGDFTVTKPDAFEYVLKFTPTVDGDLAEWELPYQVATNSVVSDWDLDSNALSSLHLAYDDDYLYVGVSGYAEAANYILGYVDVDYGAGTGVADMSGLMDNDGGGDLDDALSSVLQVTAMGFGAEFGFGSRGTEDNPTMQDLSTDVGWRGLSPVENFPWFQGILLHGDVGFETALPMSTVLAGAAIPPGGVTLAIAIKLSGPYGGTAGMSNQCLPECSVSTEIQEVAIIRLR